MTTLQQIVLPISFYLLVDSQANPNPDVSTKRCLSETQGFKPGIYEPMAQVWSQAGIKLELQSVEFMETPIDVLEGFCQASSLEDLRPHMEAVAILPHSESAVINGFYVLNMPPLNGFSHPDSRIFFVKDDPVLSNAITRISMTGRSLGARVSSHEIGHILRLRHYQEPECYDRTRLMFSGTTGMTLSSSEIVQARTTAQAILASV